MITDFKKIDSLSPSDFEIFVRDVFVAAGWSDAIITKVGQEFQHGDGGVDIFAYKAKRKFAIEVKQRAAGITVDVKALNQLVTGAKLANVTNMILVTNSYFTSEVNSPFAQFYPRFVRLWQDIFICHGNTNTHNENRTGRRHSTAISADGQDEYSCVAGQAFSNARKLARAKFRANRGRMAGLYPEQRRSSFERCAGLGGRNPDDIDSLFESGRLARIGF